MKGSPKSEASLEQSIDFEYGEYESSLDQQQPSSNLIGSSSPSSSLSLSTSTTVSSTSTGTVSSTSISKTTNTAKESINSHSVPRPSPSECSPLDKGLSSLTSSLSCSGLTSTLTSTLSTTITTSCSTSTTATILKSSSTPTPTSTPTTGHDDFFNCNNKTSAVNCGGCGHTIVDRYYLVFDDRHWHSRCLTCAECGCNLEKRCFVRNGLTYCKHDYHRLFGSFRLCSKCCQIIEPTQLVMKVNSQNFYHLDCFTCSQCYSVLHKNDYYVLIDGKIYCSDHYSSLVRESNVTSSSSSNNRGPSSLSSASPASSLSSPSSISYHQHHHQQHHLASHQHHHHQPQPQPLHLLQQNNLTSDNSISNNHINLTNGDIKSEQMFNSSNANNGAVEATQVRQTTRGRPRRKLKKEPIECNNEHSIENRPSHPLPTSSSSSVSSHPDNVFHDHLHGIGCPVDSLSDNLLDSRGLTKNSCSLPGLNGRSPMNLNGNHHHGSSSNGTSNSHSSQNGSSNNGNSKSKRVRTSFKHAQLKTMKSYFAVNQNPDAKDLKGLSTKTGLSKRVLQVWFQNARAKWRKNNPKHGDCSSTSGNSTQTKGNTSNSLTLGTGCDTNSQQSQSQLNSLNGLTSSIAPASPSTGIGSPGGSSHSRPFSTPSPSSGLTIHESSSLLLTNSNGSSLDQFPPLTGPSPTRPESPNQSLQQQQQSSSSSSSSEPLGLPLPPTGVGPTSVSSCSSPSISHHQPQHVQQHSLGPSQSPLSIPIGSHLTGVVTPHQPPSLLTSSGHALHPATSHHSALHPPLSLPIHHHSIHLHRHPEGSSMYSPFEETLLPHSTSFQPLY